jgi:2-octaprenylphenol hydroxylase
MKRSCDLVIAGAGMVGLTLAALLARADSKKKLNITVVDAGPAPQFDPANEVSLRVSALSAGSVAVLESVGAWDRIVAARACPYREMIVWDAAGSVEGPDTLHFDAAEHALPELGFIVENVLVQHALLKVLQTSDVVVQFDTRISALRQDHSNYDIEFDNDSSKFADLVIGADGAGSLVREEAGIGIKRWNYSQKAFVTHVEPQKEHRHTAWQRFQKSGPIGLLPLLDGRVSLVWSTTPEQADVALDCGERELEAMLTEASDGALGTLRPAGPRGAFPLKAQFARDYVIPGLALIGDAAHSIHPLAGQGANLGIADSSTLTDVITQALAADEYPADLPVLRRYERARKGANQSMLRVVDGLNRLFALNAEPIAMLRGSGMRIFNHSGPIKRRVVQAALGIRP